MTEKNFDDLRELADTELDDITGGANSGVNSDVSTRLLDPKVWHSMPESVKAKFVILGTKQGKYVVAWK